MKFVVLTTVNPPHVRLTEFLDLGYQVVVVGDTSTDDSKWLGMTPEIQYLSFERQADEFPRLHNLIGSRTYARKNIGYLWAIARGATIIWETDDDNFVRPSVGDPLEYILHGNRLTSTCNVVWNPYSFFAPNHKIWPRGFPLKRINEPNTGKITIDDCNDKHPEILQMLVSGEPDVDAIYRLSANSSVIEMSPSADTVRVGGKCLVPANTQATIWQGIETFPYLYIPRWVSTRFSDILKMYIAQAFIQLMHAGFLMEQFRNPHDVMADFQSEIPMYLGVDSLIDLLQKSEFCDIMSVYQGLVGLGICENRELSILDAFQNELHESLSCSSRVNITRRLQ